MITDIAEDEREGSAMTRSTGMGGHQSARMITDIWLTPPHIVKSLGEFDLDPCSPVNRPWDTAKTHYTILDNGLTLPWHGRVWLNPPYGRKMGAWLKKMARHGFGVSLIFARTDTRDFQDLVFPHIYSMLFISGRLTFYRDNGLPGQHNGGAPSVLLAYSEYDSEALAESGINGRHLLVNAIPIITISQLPNWRMVVKFSLVRLNGQGSLSDIYRTVERAFPAKVRRNRHYREKVRQVLQRYYVRAGRGQYKMEGAA